MLESSMKDEAKKMKQQQLEKEAYDLFGCEKDIFQYLVESAGSIGRSKLQKYTKSS
ncbi:MAG: hypothetical protein WEB28_02945 [Nitrosopumilaceae archaeon]